MSALIIEPPTRRRFMWAQPTGVASQSQDNSATKAASRLALQQSWKWAIEAKC